MHSSLFKKCLVRYHHRELWIDWGYTTKTNVLVCMCRFKFLNSNSVIFASSHPNQLVHCSYSELPTLFFHIVESSWSHTRAGVISTFSKFWCALFPNFDELISKCHMVGMVNLYGNSFLLWKSSPEVWDLIRKTLLWPCSTNFVPRIDFCQNCCPMVPPWGSNTIYNIHIWYIIVDLLSVCHISILILIIACNVSENTNRIIKSLNVNIYRLWRCFFPLRIGSNAEGC